MGITRVYAGVVGTGCGIDDPHSIDITRVYAGIVGAECGDRGSPHGRRPLPAYTQVLRMFCMWGSSIATVPTAITRVYAGVRGLKMLTLSTAISRVYAGVAAGRCAVCGDRQSPQCRRLLPAYTQVYWERGTQHC